MLCQVLRLRILPTTMLPRPCAVAHRQGHYANVLVLCVPPPLLHATTAANRLGSERFTHHIEVKHPVYKGTTGKFHQGSRIRIVQDGFSRRSSEIAQGGDRKGSIREGVSELRYVGHFEAKKDPQTVIFRGWTLGSSVPSTVGAPHAHSGGPFSTAEPI